jgi:hypothetical protein
MRVKIVSGHDMCHPETCSCWNYKAVRWEDERLYYNKGWYRLGEFGDTYEEVESKVLKNYPDANIE